MTTRFRPLAVFLICMPILGCGTRPGGVREAAQSATEKPPAQAGAEPTVYQAGKFPDPVQTARTGRYSYVDVGIQATQMDPLLEVIDVRLPKDIATVKGATNYLLRRSGFDLLPICELRGLTFGIAGCFAELPVEGMEQGIVGGGEVQGIGEIGTLPITFHRPFHLLALFDQSIRGIENSQQEFLNLRPRKR